MTQNSQQCSRWCEACLPRATSSVPGSATGLCQLNTPEQAGAGVQRSNDITWRGSKEMRCRAPRLNATPQAYRNPINHVSPHTHEPPPW